MRTPNTDRPREDKSNAGTYGHRWFRLYADWVKITVQSNLRCQSAEAKECYWDADLQDWIVGTRIKTIYDPLCVAHERVGDLVRAYPSAQNRRWEIIPRPKRGILFRNTASVTIPAYGCMRVTGAETLGTLTVVTVAKPSTNFQRLYLINGASEIGTTSSSTSYGFGTWLEDADWVLYNTSSGTPAYGQSWGPVNDQWNLDKWRYGFTIIGNNTSSGSTARTVAKQSEVNEFRGKTDSGVSKGSTVTVSIWDGNSADTGDNMAGVSNLFADVLSGKHVGVRWWGGTWHLGQAECG